MKCNQFVKNCWQNSHKLLLTISCIVALALGWQGNLIPSHNIAQAAPLKNNTHLLVDLGNSGLGNQIKGRAQQDIGKTQSAIDKVGQKAEKTAQRVAGQADATAKQVKGRAQQDIGKLQSEAQKSGNKIQDAAEGAMDNVKNFFSP